MSDASNRNSNNLGINCTDSQNISMSDANYNSDEFDFDSQYAMEKYMNNYFDRTETINHLFRKDDSKQAKKEKKKDANSGTTGIFGKLSSLFK